MYPQYGYPPYYPPPPIADPHYDISGDAVPQPKENPRGRWENIQAGEHGSTSESTGYYPRYAERRQPRAPICDGFCWFCGCVLAVLVTASLFIGFGFYFNFIVIK